MITGTPVIGASLITLLVDRCVLANLTGTTPFSAPSAKLSTVCGTALPVFAAISLGAAIAGAFAQFLLRPSGMEYLYPVLFVTVVAFIAFAGELLMAQRLSIEIKNRISGRSTVMAALLGLLTMAPPAAAVTWPAGVVHALISGAVFSLVTLVWNGVHEKTALSGDPEKDHPLVRELLTAALLGLVLCGVSTIPPLHAIGIH